MSIPTDRQEVEEFDRIGNDYEEWYFTAGELLRSADVLREHNAKKRYPDGKEPTTPLAGSPYGAPPVELMLCAFALECLLKALWVKRGNRLANSGNYLGLTKPERHDLVAMLTKVGVPCQPHNEETFQRLSIITIAWARYPIPRNWQDIRFRKWASGSYSPLSWSSDDQNCMESLIEWLLVELKA